MRLMLCLLSLPILLAFTAIAGAATQGVVELEIAGDSALGAGMSFQEWGRSLSDAGVHCRLRSGEEGDKPAIEIGGTAQMPVYKVTAVLGAHDELIMPGGTRYRRSECKKLAAWLDDLAKLGPPEKREKVAAFGLTAGQLQKVSADLAKPVGFSTKGMTRNEAVNKIAAQLGLILTIDGTLTGGDDKIEEELSDISCGTALAYILRPIGFCMVPRVSGETLSYIVKKTQLDKEVWPIGWPTESTQKVLPGIHEFHNVNVSNVPATKVLATIAGQIKVPVLYDRSAMAWHGIDLDKVLVSHPKERTTYSVALRRMLAKVGLKFEVRVDESGKPLLWVSTIKPV